MARIDLRSPGLEDLNAYHEVFSDSETHRFIIDEGQQDLEGSTRKLRKLIKLNGDTKAVYTITLSEIAVGFVVVHLDESCCPFISYAVGRSHLRRGVAMTALQTLLERTEFDGFFAATHLDNMPSQRLLEKLGFERLGPRKLEMGERVLFQYLHNR